MFLYMTMLLGFLFNVLMDCQYQILTKAHPLLQLSDYVLTIYAKI